MKKLMLSTARFSPVALLFVALCLSTAFYACGTTKEKVAKKEAIEKTERVTAPAPAPAKIRPTNLKVAKVKMPADTMR